MDKLINRHLDLQDELEESVKVRIDELIQKINIVSIIADPADELGKVASTIQEEIDDQYYGEAMKNGLQFAKDIQKYRKKDKDIIVEDSNDPKLNYAKSKDEDERQFPQG
jgi:hypothetical protein